VAALTVTVALATGCWDPASELAEPTAQPRDERRTCPEGLARPSPIPDQRPLPLPAGFRHGVLPSGLQYFIRSHGRPAGRAALRLVVKAGSAHERPDQRGYAHFVEHLAFTGTRLLSEVQVTELRRKAGQAGQNFNAHTDWESTRYELEVPSRDPVLLNTALLLLQQVSSDVPFDPVTVDRVRPSIIEEERRGQGASGRLQSRHLAATFRGSPYALSILGDMKIVTQATPERLRAFYRRWYRPDLMAVVAIGDFDADQVETEIRRLWGAQPRSPTAAPPPPPVPDHPETRLVFAPDRQQTTTSVSLVYRVPFEPRCNDRCSYRRQQIRIAMLGLLSKRLEDLKLSGNPPFSEVTPQYGQRLAGSDELSLRLRVDESGLLPALEIALREIDRVLLHGFTPGEVTLANLLSAPLHRNRTLDPHWPSASLADYALEHILHGLPLLEPSADRNLLEEIFPGITLCDLQAAARGLAGPANRVIMLSGPPWAAWPSEAQVRATLDGRPSRPLADYVAPTFRWRPLLRRKPAGGRVVEQKHLPEIDLFDWRLSNGVRVLIRRTDARDASVRMLGLSPGGHSLVSDTDLPAALLTADVLTASGFGDHNAGEIRRLLGDRGSFRLVLNERDEGFSATAPADRLERLLELTYLALTQPRGDPEALERRKQVSRSHLRRRELDPDRLMADEITEVYYRNHPRRRRLTAAEIEGVDLQQMMRIYRQRFGVLDDLLVVLAGPVNVMHLQPWVETYLGALPTGRTETTRDVGARPLLGSRQLQLRGGDEARATVTLDFTALAPEDSARRLLLRTVGRLLRERLLQRLRADMGGTYDVGVETFFDPAVFTSQRLRVRFVCDPKNVGRMIAAVRREAEAVRRAGFSAGEIERVRGQNLLDPEEDADSDYWALQVHTYVRKGWDLRPLGDPERMVRLLDDRALLQAARTHLDPRNLIVTVMRPIAPPPPARRRSVTHRTIL
jgi:zinc protease